MIADNIAFAFKSIRNRSMRSFLTILGIVIGIAAVVSLVSVSVGMQGFIEEQLESMGSDKIMISPGSSMLSSTGLPSSSKLTDKDLDTIKRVRGVESAFGMIYKTVMVKYGDKSVYTIVSGIDTTWEAKQLFENMQGYEIEHGRHIQEGDKGKVEIGIDVASGKTFDKKVGVRGKITIGDGDYEVVGIMKRIGNPYDDSSIIMPIDSAKELFKQDDYNTIMAKSMEGFDTANVADDVKREMKKERGISRNEKEDFSIETSEHLREQINSVLGVIQVVLVGIAAISLIVASIGIMSTMYTSVLERTREIGIMKAIGARNGSILSIFLLESGMIGLVGGFFGCLIGIIAAIIVQIVADVSGYSMLKASITPELIAFGLGVSFIVGALSGALPAKSAADLKPVDALRYE